MPQSESNNLPPSTGSNLKYNSYTKKYMTNNEKPKKQSSPSSLKFSSTHSSDDIWVGDTMNILPDRDSTRFWLQNCNGLVTANDINQFIY